LNKCKEKGVDVEYTTLNSVSGISRSRIEFWVGSLRYRCQGEDCFRVPLRHALCIGKGHRECDLVW